VKFLRRVPWYLLGGLALGIALGLVYSWMISPVEYIDGAPDALRSDFKDQFRSTIASAYFVDGDLSRARARLATLNDPDPAAALSDQANALLAAGDPDASAVELLMLVQALQSSVPTVLPPSSTAPAVIPTKILPTTVEPTSGPTFIPTETDTPLPTETPGGPPTDTPIIPDTPTLSKPPTATATSIPTLTPRPTRTFTPTPGLPFVIDSQGTVCDAKIPDGLIQVYIHDPAGYPIPGVDILVKWDGGQEHIFTGLKPELGDGYADFAMTPGILYSVQVASGSAVAKDLQAPPCESSGAKWWGNVILVFRQP
jgi:hypothetical protein